MNTDLSNYLIWIAAFLVGLSKGGLPSIGMLAVPILSLVMPTMKATMLLLPVFIASDIVGIYLYRKEYSLANLKILIPAGLFGVVLGWSLMSIISARAPSLILGLIGIFFCLNSWLRRAPKTDSAVSASGYFWGMLSGFTSFISHAGAPPFQIYMLPQKLPKLVYAGTSTIFFAAINFAKIVPYQQMQPYSVQSLKEAAILLPLALIGTWSGAWLTRRIHDRLFFLLVQIALFVVSVKLVFSAWQ